MDGPSLKPWGSRVIVNAPLVGTPVLMLVLLVIGVPGIAVTALVLRDALAMPDEHERTWALIYLSLGVTGLLCFLAPVMHWWWRGHRYSSSVCRLITLPGVAGGWFKADVQCRLPPGDEVPVVIRLRNIKVTPDVEGFEQKELWRTEQTLTLPSSRRIVPVRLRVPRDARQLLTGLRDGDSWGIWLLEIEKRAGVQRFFADFPVPVSGPRDGVTEEQRPD